MDIKDRTYTDVTPEQRANGCDDDCVNDLRREEQEKKGRHYHEFSSGEIAKMLQDLNPEEKVLWGRFKPWIEMYENLIHSVILGEGLRIKGELMLIPDIEKRLGELDLLQEKVYQARASLEANQRKTAIAQTLADSFLTGPYVQLHKGQIGYIDQEKKYSQHDLAVRVTLDPRIFFLDENTRNKVVSDMRDLIFMHHKNNCCQSIQCFSEYYTKTMDMDLFRYELGNKEKLDKVDWARVIPPVL